MIIDSSAAGASIYPNEGGITFCIIRLVLLAPGSQMLP
jgi:hypothetical protein